MEAGEQGLGMHKKGISGGEKAGTPEMKSVQKSIIGLDWLRTPSQK